MIIIFGGGVMFLTLVVALVGSIVITNRKMLEERPVEWSVYWVASWTPFAAVLFLTFLDRMWVDALW
ncbi:TPA: hypothetical protein HA259_01095 [Thermoplasmata archaeon]|nr:hypothetical protein [Thermoplasmata archaeon]